MENIELKEIPLNQIRICKDYCRAQEDNKHIENLKKSIEAFRQEVPIIVIPDTTSKKKKKEAYILLDGYHRYRGLEKANAKMAMVMICKDLPGNKEETMKAVLQVNIHKELSSVDMAKLAYIACEQEKTLSQKDVADIFRVPANRISEWLKAYKIPKLKEKMEQHSLAMQTAVQLANIPDDDRDFLLEWGTKTQTVKNEHGEEEEKISGFATKHLLAKIKKHPELLQNIKDNKVPVEAAEAIAGANGLNQKSDIMEFMHWYKDKKSNYDKNEIVGELKKRVSNVKSGKYSVAKATDKVKEYSFTPDKENKLYKHLLKHDEKYIKKIHMDENEMTIKISRQDKKILGQMMKILSD